MSFAREYAWDTILIYPGNVIRPKITMTWICEVEHLAVEPGHSAAQIHALRSAALVLGTAEASHFRLSSLGAELLFEILRSIESKSDADVSKQTVDLDNAALAPSPN
jgi:hypothetical protein